MSNQDRRDLIEREEPLRPRVVDEAEEVLTAYAWQVGGAGALALLGWAVAASLEAPLPLIWLFLALGALVLLYLSPVTREPRLAREVLRRWDHRRVDKALESAGLFDDPRLQVAESMADRIVRHPSVGPDLRDLTATLVARLHRLLRDLGRVEYLASERIVTERGSSHRSISDLQDLLDARVAEVLGQLAALHSTVVLRDTHSLGQVVGEVEELLRELEAEREVERLLRAAEQD